MRRCLIIAMIVISSPAWSDTPAVDCPLCRDVYTYPADYANHAYNQVFGGNPTLTFTEGDLMRVVASNGQWAMVDLNYRFSEFGLSLNLVFLSYAVSIPNGLIQMIVQDPRATVTEFQAFARSPDLLVGDGTTQPPGPAPDSDPEPEPPQQKPNTAGGGQEVICCQEGAYYWYTEQLVFNMQLGNE